MAVADGDTETTTIRRPVQCPPGPQTGATLRAQPVRGPPLRAIDGHRLMRTALLSQSVIDALAGTTRATGLVIGLNCQTFMALGRAAVAHSAVDSRNRCIRGA